MSGLGDVIVNINGGGPILNQLKTIGNKYDNVFINGPYNGAKEASRLYEETDVLFCGYNPRSTNNKSNSDCEPVKYFEGIFTGTPMIATSGIYFAEQVRKKMYGIACDTAESGEIRKAILKLKEDTVFYKQCQKNELNDAALYDWNKAVTILDEIYK